RGGAGRELGAPSFPPDRPVAAPRLSPVPASRGALGVCTLSFALWGGASRNVSEALGTGVALPPSRAGGDCPVRPPANCPPDVSTAGFSRTAGTGCPAEA